MITLKITNTATDEVLNEIEVTEEEFPNTQMMWSLQIELYKLDGIQSKLEVIYPNEETEP